MDKIHVDGYLVHDHDLLVSCMERFSAGQGVTNDTVCATVPSMWINNRSGLVRLAFLKIISMIAVHSVFAVVNDHWIKTSGVLNLVNKTMLGSERM